MEKQLHILIIEDSESDAALIIRFLKKADYNIKYEVVDSAPTMEAALERNRWDFVISDFTLPQFNALSALSILQATKIDIPFIVVSGTVGEETAVEIMKAGAHDYIMKENLSRLVPVLNRELLDAGIRREHHQAEEKINIQAHILDLIGQSVIMFDINNIFTYWNKASEILYGWTAEEVLGHRFKEIMTSHDDYPKNKEIKQNVDQGTSWSSEINVIKKNGFVIPVHVTYTSIPDENNNFTGAIGISFDISERRKTEEAMIRKMDELAASNDELSRINRLTIGREMRMIELKQQCNNLASQLRIEQPYPLTFINDSDQQKKK